MGKYTISKSFCKGKWFSVDVPCFVHHTKPFPCLQSVQQWPQMQKSVSKDAEEEEDSTGGINLDKAKERLQEEDKFDKEEYRKKIRAKHRVSFPSWINTE